MKVIGWVVTIVGLMTLRGWVLTYLWKWFIVPLGMPQIGVAHAIGVAVILAYITHNSYVKDRFDGEEHEHVLRIAASLFLLFMVWLMGFIVSFFM
jgi:hypothetical protein